MDRSPSARHRVKAGEVERIPVSEIECSYGQLTVDISSLGHHERCGLPKPPGGVRQAA
jgi:hypothetical protein